MSNSVLDNIRVVLSHPSHPGNIGAAARAMKTMGLHNLFLVNPRQFPDPMADAMASGANDVLQNAVICSGLEQALQGAVLVVGLTARHRDLSHVMLTLRQAVPQILERAGEAPVALIFGTEMSGLSNMELDKCQLLITIPVNPEYSSLNLAAAVQVVCYELRTCGIVTEPISKNSPPAAFEDVERFYEHLENALVEIDFLDPQDPRRLMTRLRRLFSRAGMEKEEVNILRGILTKACRGRVPK